MNCACEGFTPNNTTKNTHGAVLIFHDWSSERADCPSDLFANPVAEKLDYWLLCFVVECRCAVVT